MHPSKQLLYINYPREGISLKVHDDGTWVGVNPADMIKPETVPIIGRLFQQKHTGTSPQPPATH